MMNRGALKLAPAFLFICLVLLFGYLKSVDEANTRYPVQWNGSQWLSTNDPTANGYFRAAVDLADVPERAVLTVSGSDNIVVYVNGRKVQEQRARSMLPTAVIDVSPWLKSGRNLLAFEVNKATFPKGVQLRYELATINHAGLLQYFYSGQHVKVASRLPPVQSQLTWSDSSYDDVRWKNATIESYRQPPAQLNVSNDLFLTLPRPDMLTVFGENFWTVSVSGNLQVSDATRQAWFAIASSVPFEVVVNGVSAGMYSASDNLLELTSFRSRLHAGDNTIQFLFFTGGMPPQIAGGLIIEESGVVSTRYIEPQWLIERDAASTYINPDITAAKKALPPLSLALSSEQPIFQMAVNEAFFAPPLAQIMPWLPVLAILLFTLGAVAGGRLAGLNGSQIIDSFFLPGLIGTLSLVVAWLVAQDVRFSAREIFAWSNLLLLMLIWAMLTLASMIQTWLHRPAVATVPIDRQQEPSLGLINHYLFWLVAVAIVAIACLLRIDGLGQQALTVDEATIAGFARGVIERGYPYLMVGGMEVELATYELVPYFLAASVSILGYSDIGLRIPALLFGTATCGVIIYCGSQWFNRITGLIAGLLYAVSPWAIYWAQNCFHPSQIQFFNLLTLIAFYRLLSSDNISIRLAVFSAVAFAFSYLSWEGSGLVLPVMVVVALIMRWGNWKWFFQPNLWIAAVLILFVAIGQGIRRVLLQEPYIMVGYGKSDTSAPKLTFTDPSYDPFYYIQNFFFTEFNLALSLFFVVGLVMMFYQRRLSFVMLFVVTAYLSLTNLLGFYNAHYFYFVLPVFLLAVAAVFTYSVKGLQRVGQRISGATGNLQSGIAITLLTLLLFLPATSGLMHIYRFMGDSIDQMRVDYRPGLAGVDGRTVSLALKQYQREGDVVMSTIPLVSEHYAEEKGSYFIQTITDRKVVYDTVRQSPYYVDKFVGNPVLRSKQELQDVLQQHERVLFVAAPVRGLNRIIDAETLEYINTHMTVVAESYDSRLYLWEK